MLKINYKLGAFLDTMQFFYDCKKKLPTSCLPQLETWF